MEHSLGLDHILGHKSNLSKFKKTEFVFPATMLRLDINYKKRKTVKKHKHIEINTICF